MEEVLLGRARNDFIFHGGGMSVRFYGETKRDSFVQQSMVGGIECESNPRKIHVDSNKINVETETLN